MSVEGDGTTLHADSVRAETKCCNYMWHARQGCGGTHDRIHMAQPSSSDNSGGAGREGEGTAGGQGPRDPRASPILSESSGFFYK